MTTLLSEINGPNGRSDREWMITFRGSTDRWAEEPVQKEAIAEVQLVFGVSTAAASERRAILSGGRVTADEVVYFKAEGLLPLSFLLQQPVHFYCSNLI